MGILTSSFLFDAFAVIVTLFTLIYTYFNYVYRHWARLGVPYEEPSIPFGSFESPFNRTEDRITFMRRLYDKHKKLGHRHFGTYLLDKPLYVAVDVDIIRSVVAKDFPHFMNRGIFYNEKVDPLSGHLFLLDGAKWKNMRVKLTPTFTSGKMKMMFNTLVECSLGMVQTIEKSLKENTPVEIKEVAGCFTTDVIGSCAFGLECNSFKDTDAPFRKYGRKIFEAKLLNFVKSTFSFVFPNLTKKLGIKQMDPEVESFLLNVVKDTVAYRENNNYYRNDFLQLLIDIKNKKDADGNSSPFTLEEIAAQVFVFFIAGYETSSTAMTFSIFELSRSKDIQSKAREEVRSVLAKHGGKLSYEAVQEMKYVGQIVDEALRKYPPLPQLNRAVTKDYKIPDTDVVLRTGDSLLIPTVALHYDPEYFPDPEKFDPDRFSDENKGNIKPYTYMPFGEGPRNCIGLRFGLMQSKVGLAVLLKDYEFSLNEATKVPLELKKTTIFISTVDPILFDVTRVE